MSYTTGMCKKEKKGRGYSEIEALERIYIVKPTTTTGHIVVPKILIGKRIRITIIK